MKQTAVEWLSTQLQIGINNNDVSFYDLIEQAKEMEKQQIIDAYTHDRVLLKITAEQYYNETYKNQ
jgi:hypothetical protein